MFHGRTQSTACARSSLRVDVDPYRCERATRLRLERNRSLAVTRLA